MSDRALDLAKFVAEESDEVATGNLIYVLTEKFGDLGREEFERGLEIGLELLDQRVAEYETESAAFFAEVERRKAAKNAA